MKLTTNKTSVAARRRVLALHCSGANAAQWRGLGEMLGTGYELLAPEHFAPDGEPWTGGNPFTLADEARRSIALIDAGEAPVHLVGHSYGGGVALQIALARPHLIASMALYEPAAFHLLDHMGAEAAPAFLEIAAVARAVTRGVAAGENAAAAAAFVDYWNGPGTWSLSRPQVQANLTRWVPKAPLEFSALIDNPTMPEAYQNIGCPVLVLRGARAPAPTRLIADGLPDLLPCARVAVIPGAGHMGAVTHAAVSNALIAQHIAEADGAHRSAAAA